VERCRGILERAAQSAYKMSRVLAFDEVVSGRSLRLYSDRRWVNPMADATAEKPSGNLDLSWRRADRDGALDVDLRPWFFSNYYSVSPGMLSQISGNADGSTDLFLGPKAPEGREKNWLATVPGRGYFAILRLYGPTEAALAKTWKPGDFELVK